MPQFPSHIMAGFAVIGLAVNVAAFALFTALGIGKAACKWFM